MSPCQFIQGNPDPRELKRTYISTKQKDIRFYSLGVFCFKTARQQVGDKQKSFACRVVDHERPTTENWRDYFIGFNDTTKQYVWDSLEPTKPLMIPGNAESLALRAATETEVAAIAPKVNKF